MICAKISDFYEGHNSFLKIGYSQIRGKIYRVFEMMRGFAALR